MIANVLLRLLPRRPNMHESDLRLNVLLKGPIPTVQPLQFFGSNLVANCGNYYGFDPFCRS